MTGRPTDDDRLADPPEDPLFGELEVEPDPRDDDVSPIFAELAAGSNGAAPAPVDDTAAEESADSADPVDAEGVEEPADVEQSEAVVQPEDIEKPAEPQAASESAEPTPEPEADPPEVTAEAAPGTLDDVVVDAEAAVESAEAAEPVEQAQPASNAEPVVTVDPATVTASRQLEPVPPAPVDDAPVDDAPADETGEPGPAATVPEPPEPQPKPFPQPPPEPEPGDEPLPPVEPVPRPGPVAPPPRLARPPERTPERPDRIPERPPEQTLRVAPVTTPPPPVGTTAREPAPWLSAERTVALPIVTSEAQTEILQPVRPSPMRTGPQVRSPAAFPPPAQAPPRMTPPAGSPVPPTRIPAGTGPPTPPSGGPTPPGRTPWSPRKAVTAVVAAIVGLFAVLYVVDVVTSSGEVPRGVTVAGVDIGGMSHGAAEQKLRDVIEPRLGAPVALRAGAVDLTLDPKQAGLELDWAGTVDAAGDQSLNPLTRLTSLFKHENKDTVTIADRAQVVAALEELRPQIDREAAEGTIRFEGLTPVPVDPVVGQQLDVEAAVDEVLDHWADGTPVELPVETTPVSTTPEGVARAVETIARPAVSRPVTVTGEGVQGVLAPADIAAALRFTPDGDGGLVAALDPVAVQTVLGPSMAPSEQPGKDATFLIQNGIPVLQPSTDGRAVNWPKTLEPAPNVLTAPGNRVLAAVYDHQPAKLTTEQANGLGIKELVGEFTTGGFSSDSGRNIKQAAAQVNGAIVKPGETFSLNGHTGPRDASKGYVLAGIIEAGRPAKGIGGGVSQFATTLYNASYFAGMVDVEHKEHSYYISRYPAAREATVYEGAIDLKFKNDGPTGILITTSWTPGDVTVQLWGTKRYDVESITGERFNYTNPPVRNVPPGEPCTPTNGTSGFSVTNTRVLREVGTGREVDRQTRTVRYTGQQQTVCPPPPPVPGAPVDPGALPPAPPAPGG